jgi:hypothetical protein
MYNLFLAGSQYHCALVKTILENDSDIKFTDNLNKADLLYAVYGPGITRKTLKYWMFSQKPVLIHWIGKDTFIFNDSSQGIRRKIYDKLKLVLLKSRIKQGNVKYLSSAPWLAKDVERLTNVKTEYLVLTSIEKGLLLEPKEEREFDFITYVPINDFDMYYGSEFLRIIEETPNRKFCLVCPDLTDINDWPYKIYENLKIQTRTNKEGFYECLNNSKTFIRMKNGGDAIALSVLEALAHGCNVVWNLKFNHCEYETRESFKENYREYFQDQFNINYNSIEYIKQEYDVEKWKLDFKKIVVEIIN